MHFYVVALKETVSHPQFGRVGRSRLEEDPLNRVPIFLIAVAVHLMRRRSGLVLTRQLCALTPRMRTEV
jgi:hypothetical protein